jgi:hypothetical protein
LYRLTAGDFLIRDIGALLAASAHLDRHVAQCRSKESQARRLLVVRTTDVPQLAKRLFLKLLDGRHKIILALKCSRLTNGKPWPSARRGDVAAQQTQCAADGCRIFVIFYAIQVLDPP